MLARVWLVAPATTSSARGGHRATNFRWHRELTLAGIHEMRHVVIIMQENLSFDIYFGAYQHAHGIPGLAGHRGRNPLPA